jgi:hypothetical protein
VPDLERSEALGQVPLEVVRDADGASSTTIERRTNGT